MSDTAILIGAGFSVPDGYKKASDLNRRLRQINPDDILIHSSGTALFLNGQKDNNAHLSVPKRYFVSQFIEFYVTKVVKLEDFDYEEFYDYYKWLQRGTIKSADFDEFCKKYKKEFHQDTVSNNNLINDFNNTFNQLLGQQLWKPIENTYYFNYPLYESILTFMRQRGEKGNVHIHTLNHDLLFEKLSNTSYLEAKVDDGFEEMGSPYYGKLDNGYKVRLRFFADKFENRYRMYKLHGSIDQIRFYSKDDSVTAIKTVQGVGITEFYKEYKDTDGKLKYENCWINYHADFLSGTTEKIKMYGSEYYYKRIFEHFNANLKSSDYLIVIGYSFRDSAINQMINESFLNKENKRIIVIDPYMPKIEDILKTEKIDKIEKSVSDLTLQELNNCIK